MQLDELYSRLFEAPGLLKLDFAGLLHFITLATRLRHDISIGQKELVALSPYAPPALDLRTKKSLSALMGYDEGTLDALWAVTKEIIWEGASLPEMVRQNDFKALLQSTLPSETDSMRLGKGSRFVCMCSVRS